MRSLIVSIGAGWQQSPSINKFIASGFRVIAIENGQVANNLDSRCIVKNIPFEPNLVLKSISNVQHLVAFAFNNDAGQTCAELINKRVSERFIRHPDTNIFSKKSALRGLIEREGLDQYLPPYLVLRKGAANLFHDFVRSAPQGLIIKPNIGSGSRAISKISNSVTAYQLGGILDKALNSSPDQAAIVECFVPGLEYSIEGLIDALGIVEIFAISKRVLVGDTFSAQKITMITRKSPTFLTLKTWAELFFKTLSVKPTLFHCEVILSGETIFCIDLGFRGGGYWVSDYLVTRSLGTNPYHYLFDRIQNGVNPVEPSSELREVLYLSNKDDQVSWTNSTTNVKTEDYLALEPSGLIGTDAARWGVVGRKTRDS